MLEIGRSKKLIMVKNTDFGMYLAETPESPDRVLLPKKQVPEGASKGDEIEVFLYKDTKDRLISTVRKPLIRVGEVAYLSCSEVTKIGAFLDMGLERDLLLPYHEMVYKVKQGDKCLVTMYVDKSGRLAATGRVYNFLRSDSPYRTGDEVSCTIYEISEKLGAFAAVDGLYSGLIPAREWTDEYECGQTVKARVTRVRPDGKLNLSLRDKAYMQIEPDARAVFELIKKNGGKLPFNDHADPELIKKECHMSKNAFKRAVGHLLKEDKIIIDEDSIRIQEEEE